LKYDYASTMLDMTNGTVPNSTFVDGRSFLPVAEGNFPADWHTTIMTRGISRPLTIILTYHAVMTQRYTYAEYGTKEKELYDRAVDPYQLKSTEQPRL
jgi:hypothetical protein